MYLHQVQQRPQALCVLREVHGENKRKNLCSLCLHWAAGTYVNSVVNAPETHESIRSQ